MAQLNYRANLAASAFPLRSEDQGRTVIIKQYDQNYIPPVASQADPDKDIGIPQLFYAHNVMPTASGYQSIGYKKVTEAASPTETGFLQVIQIRNIEVNFTARLGFCADGKVYISVAPFSVWSYVTTLSNTGGKRITYAQVNGETYLYIYKSGCYKYNTVTSTLDLITLTGLAFSDIVGITSYGGYLIAYGDNAVYWSSTVDPTDFTPSLSTGAGGGQLQEARGPIIVAVATLSGFLIYTTANIVAAIASGNTRYPFNFRGLAGSSGLSDSTLVTVNETVGAQYSYTTAGFTLSSPTESKVVIPEATDFIAGSVFEDFNETTNLFELTDLSGASLLKRITLVASRYLVISYGITTFTHALVLDIALKRWGKLKITHVDCLELSTISALTEETPKNSIGFVAANGEINYVEFSPYYSEAVGVAILGKYQLHRSRLVQLNEVTVENIRPALPFSLQALVSLNGKDYSVKDGYLARTDGLAKTYYFFCVGVNISLLAKGAFSLSSLLLNISLNGSS